MSKTAYYISGTHWDREWYQPFQGFRLQLVDALDHLIDVLEHDPEIKVFHLDGQTIVLDDYMEIRPENREKLEKLIRDGRILIGPWYCMPDEFLISGEAMIRNLQKGFELSRQWGTEPWKCGYICDIFGHIAQMPQILNGFDIAASALSRGTNAEHITPFFIWKSPDGSEVMAYKMPEESGYGSFAMDVVGQRHCGEYVSPDDPKFSQQAARYLDNEFARSDIPVVLIMDAHDHEPIHRDIVRYMDKMRQMYPDVEFKLTNMLDAFDAVKPYRSLMTVREGELNETAHVKGLHLHLLSHTLSSRYELKKRNDDCQILLERWLEPMNCIYAESGLSYSPQYLNVGWTNLLQNQPHDSICGCSIDRVHRDMEYRFSQVESLHQALMEKCEAKLAGGRFLLDSRKEHDRVTVLNPLPYAYTDNVTLELPFEPGYPTWQEPFGYQEIKAFRLYTAEGEEIPYVLRSVRNNEKFRSFGERTIQTDCCTVTFPLTLRAAGSTEIRVVPQDTPVRFMGGLADMDGKLENEHVKVTVEADGCLELTDKAANRTYRRLCGLFDGGEIGDGWNSVSPCRDETAVRSVLRGVYVTANNPVYSEIRVDRELLVPEKMEYGLHELSRSQRQTAIRTEMYVGLGHNDSAVSVRLKVCNNGCGHKLKLRMPTGIAAPNYEVNQTFAFLRRACGVDTSTADWKEKDCLEKAMSGIVLKRDETGTGLAFVSRSGLHECGADSDAEGSIYVTLLRSYKMTVTTNGEIGGEELGEHEYEFRLVPVNASLDNSALQRMQDIMQSGVRSFVSAAGVDLPTLLRVEGAVCVSAMKQAADGSGDLILRVYNPEAASATFCVYPGKDWKEAVLCNLREVPGETVIPVENGGLELTAAPYKILTLRFRDRK